MGGCPGSKLVDWFTVMIVDESPPTDQYGQLAVTEGMLHWQSMGGILMANPNGWVTIQIR